MPFDRRLIVRLLLFVALAATAFAVARYKRDFVDFEVYRTAGVRALHGEPLYRPEDGHYQFKYWPGFALAMAPFAIINDEVGKVIWYAGEIAAIAWLLGASIGALPSRRSTTKFLAIWTLILTGKFIVKELVNGQTNAFLGVLILLAVFAARRHRRVAAGALIGAAAFLKPYALLLIPWIGLTDGLVPLVAAGIVLVAGWLLPALVYGWQGNLDLLHEWYRTVTGTTAPNLLFPENISFAAMWAKWLGPGTVASSLALVSAVVALAGFVMVWTRRSRVAQPDFLEVGLLLLLMPLVSPQGWDYVLLLGIPAFVCLVDRFRESPRAWQATAAAGWVLVSFTIFDLVGRRAYYALMDASVISVGAILLVACLIHLRMRSLA